MVNWAGTRCEDACAVTCQRKREGKGVELGGVVGRAGEGEGTESGSRTTWGEAVGESEPFRAVYIRAGGTHPAIVLAADVTVVGQGRLLLNRAKIESRWQCFNNLVRRFYSPPPSYYRLSYSFPL